MMMSTTEEVYRNTAVAGASGFGMLIALYETLAGNLQRAADAERKNDLEKRAQEMNHAFLVVGYLENWMEQGSGGELARRLTRFYASLRRKMIQAQAKRSAEMLEQQLALVLKVRSTWQEIELRGSVAEDHPDWAQTLNDPEALSEPSERSSSSWSA
jgi:flagellar biosynthetic protein FliS